ncbi:hypothetical protein BGZ75_007288 [Mortierella antarctica]|nr:hypothetical protein BGZ75_007288 [Mortierella antarctica]
MADHTGGSRAMQLDDSPDSNSSDTNSATNIDTSTAGGSSTVALPSIGSATTYNTAAGASSGFALPASNPFTDSSGPPNPFSPVGSPSETPVVTPLGSPKEELRKLSLGVERYARAIEDPGPMGSFSGTVPLPSLSQSHIQIATARRRPSHILLDAIASSSSPVDSNMISSPKADGAEASARTGLTLNSIKRAISGKRRAVDMSMADLESNPASNSLNNSHAQGSSAPQGAGTTLADIASPFGSQMCSPNMDAQVALLGSLSYSPQPLLLPAAAAASVSTQAGRKDANLPIEPDEIRRRLEQSNTPTVAITANAEEQTIVIDDTTATAGIRHRKPKGGILSQLLKLQRNEAAAATARASGSKQRQPGSAQHAAVKKTKKGFYYRSSKNNSLADLGSPSATTTPKVSPRNSRIFDFDSYSPSATTRLPTQPPTSINNSTFTKPTPHENIEEMEAISAAATAATLSATLGIQRDIAEILTRQSFLIMIAKAMILYGAPSHRIEETCALLARRMDVDASFALLPGLMTISFSDPETHTSDTRHLRCTQGMDMYKLSKVYTIAWGVLHGKGIEEANRELEKVTVEPGYYPVWVTVMSWMTCAAFVAPLAFNGSWLDTLLAGLCGLLVGLLGLVAAKFPVYGNVFEVTSSILVGFIAKAFGDRVCFSAVALAGVVVLLPGLLLTQAIMELASRNIVSGAVRMFYALMYAFFLGFGLSLGAELWDFVSGDISKAPASACEKNVNPWWLFLIFPAVSTSINIVFNAHPNQWLGMTLVTAVGYTVSYFMKSGPQVTPAVAAFAVGLAGQAYGRITGKLSYVPLLSGVLLLVPGSVGVKGVLAIIGSDPSQGFQFALSMVNIAVSITAAIHMSLPSDQPVQGRDPREEADQDEDSTSLFVETSWQEQPVRLPAYTPSSAAKEINPDSPPTTPVDDPIHLWGSKKHFGFSSKKSIASSIFPWQKHKPAVCHQYAPHRPPLSKRSSLAGLKVMPMSSPDPVRHLDDEELDLLTLKGDQLPQRVLELLHLMDVQDWAEVTDYHDLKLDRISGAMTNCIFLVTGPAPSHNPAVSDTAQAPKPRKVLLRVYGIGLEALFSRSKELHWLHNLSTMDIGPSLLGIFKNGRFEQYVESTTLTKDDIRDPRTSRHIAHRMCELHNIVNVFPPPEGTIPQSQENIAKWIPLAKDAIVKICAKDPAKKAIMDEFDFDKLLREIEEVHQELMTVHSPVVFAHNDTQYGNILRATDDEDGELVVIDFEYAGYNTRGFDIGNHFCEWTADYHSERPSVLHPSRYPTKAEQLNFLEAYMEAEIAMCGYHLTAINLSKYAKKRKSITQAITKGLGKVALSAVTAAISANKREGRTTEFQSEEEATAEAVATEAVAKDGVAKGNSALENEIVVPRKKREAGDGGGGVSKAEILDSMYKEVNKFALTSHIMWGLWGLIQATQSEIDFDYFEYSLQRLSEFRRRREEFMML